MVGSYVMAELIRAGCPIAVLARSKGKQSATDRIDQILTRFELAWGVPLVRPPVFRADLTLPGLGLSKEERRWIAQHCDQILHSAASLRFAPAADHPENEPYRTNVEGTRSLIDFCDAVGIDRIHHVSTAYVCGMRHGRVLESDHDIHLEFANDYEQSKADAELLVDNAFARDRRTLYRPSIVVDPTGLAPVSGDRTIYGAFSMYQMLSSRFGLPQPGQWMKNLGFRGNERKNLIDAHWIAKVIAKGIVTPSMHGRNYHLTSEQGTAIETLDEAFRNATEAWLGKRRVKPARANPNSQRLGATNAAAVQAEIDLLAAPFVKTFLPYFRDDPVFDRTHIEWAMVHAHLPPTPIIDLSALSMMIDNWSAPSPRQVSSPAGIASDSGNTKDLNSAGEPSSAGKPSSAGISENADDVVICGYAVRLPGNVDGIDDFTRLLFEGRCAIDVMPENRLDRSLYFDSRRGVPGKTYTQLGGCVDPEPLDVAVENEINALGDFDLTHRQFAQVAAAAFRHAGVANLTGFDPQRGGVFVGHSGGTQSGGPLAMSTMAETAISMLASTSAAQRLPEPTRSRLMEETVARIRTGRPRRDDRGGPELNAYSAASLTARLLGLQGRREVVDAACSSSLIALQHATDAISHDRLDLAVVGGATFNNVDNLALFSQSGACSDAGCHPFDSRASGLISSEGYVAIVIARRSVAQANGLPIHAVIAGVGIASDGKGKGLWAPRSEGQQLAMQRACQNGQNSQRPALQVDYLECHATSTQVGDATELESLTALLQSQPARESRLPIGSAKSNLGHLLEAAGLVGVVKCLLAMRNDQIPPSIGFASPSEQHNWENSPVEVVQHTRPWSRQNGRDLKVAGVNAFGIGGLNAHAIIEEPSSQGRQRQTIRNRLPIANHRYAIVGRGLIVPGAENVEQWKTLLDGTQTQIGEPPSDRWISHLQGDRKGHPIGVGSVVPHCRGAFVEGFQFDAQSYRIPPKLVRHANPAQLMLIEAVRQAIDEFDSHQWTVDRQRIGVSVGTIFGGQFSNELQVGLRMPEIRQTLVRVAEELGIPSGRIAKMADEYEEIVLDRYPALLDETGGFTASTLASAIARVFNLMGGAYAVDADEASSGLAILSAMERLDRGEVDLMICGATHRAMDLVAFEQLYRKGQLVTSGRIEDLPKDGSRIFPGEGVATLLIQRFDDAVTQGRTIYGVIDGVTETFATDVDQARQAANAHSIARDPHSCYDTARRIGHLGGAHSMVRTITATLPSSQRSDPTTQIHDVACDGYQIQYRVSPIDSTDNSQHEPQHQSTPVLNALPKVITRSLSSAPQSDGKLLTIRMQAESAETMRAGLESLLERPLASPAIAVDRFSSHEDLFQAAIIAHDGSQVQSAAAALIEGPLAQHASSSLSRQSAWLRSPTSNTGTGKRTAWLFPGQGSQYAEVPSLVHASASARDFLCRFDETLARFGVAPVRDRLQDPQGELGRNIWWTQLWVLATGAMQANELKVRGYRPDIVLGHSFGECTAAWCAGVMSTEQAIKFAKQRSESVILAAPTDGELLSVRGTPPAVTTALHGSSILYSVTHHNAPEQTVIAGTPSAMTKAKDVLSQAGLASVVIPVPAAFHTPGMRPAQDLLAARFGSEIARPPRYGFLSAVSNRYLAEPADILTNLIEQLTRPVCFANAVSRLADDGCGLMIEVGPSDVLTRLARESVGNRTICLSFDNRSLDRGIQDALIETAVEAFNGHVGSKVSTIAQTSDTSVPLAGSVDQETAWVRSQNGPKRSSAFAVVDVTKRGRDVKGREVRGRDIGGGKPIATHPAPVASDNRSRVPVVTPAPATSQWDLAKSFLFDLVVDLTGYDPEIIEFDADLEGELGVDSIKKAQLIGELVQWADLEIDLQSMQLSQFHSLADILALLGDGSMLGGADELASMAPASVEREPEEQHLDEPIPTIPETITVDSESLQRMIIDLVVDQTGYDEDIIDMDADLEGELGIDSIKRAQLIGELETHYNLQSLRETNLQLSDFPTLASIHAYVLDHLEQATGVPSETLGEKKNDSKNDDSARNTELARGGAASSESLLSEPSSLPPAPSKGTHRFVLETVVAPRRAGMPSEPIFTGPAIVLGDNPVADALVQKLSDRSVSVTKIGSEVRLAEVDSILDAIWDRGVTPHLFLTTPCDEAALWVTTDAPAWKARQEAAFSVPYRVCQRWMQRIIEDEVIPRSSLISIVRGGGNFSFDSMDLPSQSILANRSSESGGIAGLTKAMRIEAWMRGFRETPMLVIDWPVGASPNAIVEGAFREFATPSHDEEVVVEGEHRQRTRARYQPLSDAELHRASAEPIATQFPLTKGGVWVVAGGGRGITAMTAMELAQRHNLKLHLLGMAQTQPIDLQTRNLAQSNRAALRRQTMARVQAEGRNPVKYWRDYEKAIEIDQTLLQCEQRGIQASYHSVDVSDHEATRRLLDQIRAIDGPLSGVIQGAGSGQDARFDRKRPDKVEQCLSAKIDGCASLAAATEQDPLEWFIGFGSISGRFGANGHTDYSAANDMLAKMIGRLSAQRPRTRCVTFHWHAWGDIGMAAKPEAKLALDMIGMEFMPAQDGLQHFINEIENGGTQNEVLITDRRYTRKFFPNDGETSHVTKVSMLDPVARGFSSTSSNLSAFTVTLDPTTDTFLSEHLVHGRPTLPFVMAIEMMAEAARVHASGGLPDRLGSLRLENVVAKRPLKCLSDDAFAVEIVLDLESQRWRLVSDLRRKDGRIVESAREHFSANIQLEEIDLVAGIESWNHENSFRRDLLDSASKIDPPYLGEDAPVHHGPSLRCLREIQMVSPPNGTPLALGTIVAPSPAHLGGENRPLDGWCICPATMDAVLYAAGMLAFHVGQRPSLPIQFERIQTGRLPDPGEPLRIQLSWCHTVASSASDPGGGRMSAILLGQNDDLILQLAGYRVGWLG